MDFTNLPLVIGRAYNGANGKKIAIDYEGEIYMLKFPPVPNQKQSEMSYTNSCLSEYICCHIFDMVGIPVQKTILGTFNLNGKEKIVCACKDFTDETKTLFDFCSIKNTVIDSELNGKGIELEEILETIELQQFVDPESLKNHFFNMFILDALVGNFDRHNGNWGFIFDRNTKKYEIAPIYDCGSCLLPQADDKRLKTMMENQGDFNSRIYNYPLSAIQILGKKINYYNFINSLENEECNQAIMRIMPKIDIEKIYKMLDETPYISKIQKDFYKKFISSRYEKILLPAYQQLLTIKHIFSNDSQLQDFNFEIKM